MTLKVGDRVKFTRPARTRMQWARLVFNNNTEMRGRFFIARDHVREFRHSIGVVSEILDHETVDVRWEPHNLRYMYNVRDLQLALPWERMKR